MKNVEMLWGLSCASSILCHQEKRRWNLVKKIWSSWDFDYSTSKAEKKAQEMQSVVQFAKSSGVQKIDWSFKKREVLLHNWGLIWRLMDGYKMILHVLFSCHMIYEWCIVKDSPIRIWFKSFSILVAWMKGHLFWKRLMEEEINRAKKRAPSRPHSSVI